MIDTRIVFKYVYEWSFVHGLIKYRSDKCHQVLILKVLEVVVVLLIHLTP